jgi:hypothetical protein
MNNETNQSPAPVHRLVGQTIYSWSHAVIEAYRPLDSTDGWERCPNCGEHPRVWVFNNGNHAKCKCQYKYEGGVHAESIIDAVLVRKVPYVEWKSYLRTAWNARCMSNAADQQPPRSAESDLLGDKK